MNDATAYNVSVKLLRHEYVKRLHNILSVIKTR